MPKKSKKIYIVISKYISTVVFLLVLAAGEHELLLFLPVDLCSLSFCPLVLKCYTYNRLCYLNYYHISLSV